MKKKVLFVSIFVLVMAPKLVVASDAEKLAFGEYLSAECVTCHQPTGADMGIPSIVGWEPIQFVAVMTAYKDRDLQNSVMQNIAGHLTEEEIEALALYFRAQK